MLLSRFSILESLFVFIVLFIFLGNISFPGGSNPPKISWILITFLLLWSGPYVEWYSSLPHICACSTGLLFTDSKQPSPWTSTIYEQAIKNKLTLQHRNAVLHWKWFLLLIDQRLILFVLLFSWWIVRKSQSSIFKCLLLSASCFFIFYFTIESNIEKK